MNDKQFAELRDAVRMMGKHMRGEKVPGMRRRRVPDTDVKTIREAAQVSQNEFARLIGVNVRTLQNWEQHRSRPTGAARALLKILAANPRAALKALHA